VAGKIRPGPTDRQQELIDFIDRFTARQGYPPTIREMGAALGITSTNGVRVMLTSLERKGIIQRVSHKSRGVTFSDSKYRKSGGSPAGLRVRKQQVPIVGRVAAGAPLLAIENIEGYLTVDADLYPFRDGFALRVQGRSMIDAGIMDGDIVIARPSLPIEPGSIVVALIGDEATVKRYYLSGESVRLEPANPDFGPINVDRDTPGFSIVGRVVGLYRRY